ncbi:uncharacterized protein GGS22DRAFT_150728 [Annulohypoxylon maeteangense]|uniref:uncharacterized protein n=1 Tax=Annulohypoxylon maeteangense TaxID=1927788 RepID=UPI0020083AAA|nr:uncharacterized protein GGS22DRAFT_150728 [Annulohypoxylon maeteangense]KAI0890377.1 hypothetical protein GGS22DRAFT_150728 [Annulohypoxylon maeteangense]
MFKKIFFLSTFALGATALNETINGYKYFLSGPNVDLSKSQYEHDAANTAFTLLKKRLGSEPLPDLPSDNVEAVLKLKQTLGTEKLKKMLEPDMDEADEFWNSAIDKSHNNSWVSADARGVAFLPNVTYLQFAQWYASANADAANLAAEPEHYAKDTVANGSELSSKILEGWGGVTTNFTIPNFGAPDRNKDPFLRPLPEFPIQQAGDKNLRDGTRFGVLHISVRPVSGKDYGQSFDGFEVYSTVWYQDGVSDDHLDQERRHMVVEIVNLTLQSQEDIASGKLAV